MTDLWITLFGGFRMRHITSPYDVKVTTNLQLLLAYLLLFRDRAHSRDVIMELFWGEQDQARARACLNTALWRLRRIVEPNGLTEKGSYLATNHTGEISFNYASDCWLDVAEFERHVTPNLRRPISTLQPADIQQLEKGLQLYRGDLLEGVYADWALHERERYRELYLTALYHLMSYYAHHRQYLDGLRCGQLILRCDPLREHIHRDMMLLYANSGQRGQAVHQYHACEQILKTELGIAPMTETQLLYEQIVSDQTDVSGEDNIHQTIEELLALFTEMQQKFRHVLYLLDHPCSQFPDPTLPNPADRSPHST